MLRFGQEQKYRNTQRSQSTTYLEYYEILTVCYYHVMYELQSESTLFSLPECQGTP